MPRSTRIAPKQADVDDEAPPKDPRRLVARLKPYEPRMGHVLQTFVTRGKRYREADGWYDVTEGEAKHLRKVHQDPDDTRTPLAFDVLPFNEAQDLEDAERAEKEKRELSIRTPRVRRANSSHSEEQQRRYAEDDAPASTSLSTGDLRGGGGRRPAGRSTRSAG